MLFVILGWVLFRAPNMGIAFAYMKGMFGIGAAGFIGKVELTYLAQNWIYFVMAVLGCFPFLPKLDEKLANSKVWNVVYTIGILAVLLVSVSFICNNAYNPFIYFNF